MTTDRIEFYEWLNTLMDQRSWTSAELARKTGLDPSYISRLRTGVRKPGVKVAKLIANATGTDETFVFRLAGLHSDAPSQSDVRSEEADALFARLTPDDQDEILALMRMKIKRRQRAGKNSHRRGEAKDGSAI